MLVRMMLVAVAAVAAVALAVPASADDCREERGTAAGTGRVRVAHLSPDAPAVDILVNGQAAITGLAFKDVSPYATLPAGTYDVAVTPAGMNGTVVLSAQLPVQERADVTVVAVGTLDSIGLLVVPDDNSAPAAGNTKVRFVHASPDAPAVDIAVKGGPVLFSNVGFKAFSDAIQVPAGTYDLEVRVAGTDTVALELPAVALRDGQVVTVFAAGLLSDGTLTAVAAE